ncbi:MAG: regulatory protein RecX [Clostridia bacterium]|nr:regulatory protein RecX [Clostridia bacterium]
MSDAIVQKIRRVRKFLQVDTTRGTLSLTYAQFRERPFQEGDEFDLDAYDLWLAPKQYPACMKTAGTILSSKDYTEKELRQKLLRIGYRPLTVDMTINKLLELHFLDDAAYAKRYVEGYAEQRRGKRRIAMDLRKKGLGQEDIDAALELVDPDDELQHAQEIARQKLQRIPDGEDPRKTTQKILAMLARRGYSYDTAKEAISLAREDLENDS